ncbi:MobV family relaxase, partial [Photobacterium leiognathi]
NAVLCVEYLMTASPEFFQTASKAQQEQFFQRSKEWLEDRHGKENVITTTIHRDETTPHMVAYVVPLAWNDKKKKETLNARHFLGGREKLSEMQTSFHEKVKDLGLDRGVHKSSATHTSIKEFYSKIQTPTPKLKDVAKEIDFPEPKFLESKESYGERVARTVWNSACDNLENEYLKSTVNDYSKLEKESKEDKNKINSLENKITKLNKEIELNKEGNDLIKKINSLPENEAKAFINLLDRKVRENQEERCRNFMSSHTESMSKSENKQGFSMKR